MVSKVEISPNPHAVDSVTFEVVSYTSSLVDRFGNPVIFSVCKPSIATHPLWRLRSVETVYDVYRDGVWTRDLQGVGSGLTVDDLVTARAYDYSYDSQLAGLTQHVLKSITLVFEHSYTGALVRIGAALVTSDGKLVVDD